MTADSLGLIPQDLCASGPSCNDTFQNEIVWAFGSRAFRGRLGLLPTLDLAIIENEPLDTQTKAELHYVLSESSLPVRIDVVEWARLTPSFRTIIQENHVVLIPKSILIFLFHLPAAASATAAAFPPENPPPPKPLLPELELAASPPTKSRWTSTCSSSRQT